MSTPEHIKMLRGLLKEQRDQIIYYEQDLKRTEATLEESRMRAEQIVTALSLLGYTDDPTKDATTATPIKGSAKEVLAKVEAFWREERKGVMTTTTNGLPPEQGLDTSAPGAINPLTGQHSQYWVLDESERAKGFIRPVRNSYIHARNGNVQGQTKGCGVVTRMGDALAETYARDPKFYGATFCVGCKTHLPVSQFDWDGTTEAVGS